jgi:TatD DNase family protein
VVHRRRAPARRAHLRRRRDLAALGALLDTGAVAVGECGLDYHYGAAHRDAQIAAFRAQITLAAERQLPLVVHTREAEADTRALVDQARALGARGVLHCYTGSAALAEHALAAGWFVSFSGIVTFRTWTDDALLRLVPHDRLLIESDAPYLAPVPHRGRRNEPAWCGRTLERVAAARATAPAVLGLQVTRNARRFFGLEPAGDVS